MIDSVHQGSEAQTRTVVIFSLVQTATNIFDLMSPQGWLGQMFKAEGRLEPYTVDERPHVNSQFAAWTEKVVKLVNMSRILLEHGHDSRVTFSLPNSFDFSDQTSPHMSDKLHRFVFV